MPTLDKIRVSHSGPKNAKLAVVGMAPAKEEIAIGRPLVGPSGRMLDEGLSYYNVDRADVFVTNIVEFPLSQDGKLSDIPKAILNVELNRCIAELREVNPNVILLLGGEPFNLLTNHKPDNLGSTGIMKWRGSILESNIGRANSTYIKCVPTVHPSFVLHGFYKWKPVLLHIDIKRAVEESKSPEINLPKREAIVGPSFSTTIDYIDYCIDMAINHGHKLSLDIETVRFDNNSMGSISCVGIGVSHNEALCIPLVRDGLIPYFTLSQEVVVWEHIAKLLQNPSVRIVTQNGSFEWIYFWTHKIFPANPYGDTMYRHHCLYPDWGGTEDIWQAKKRFDEPGHGLAFINSQFTRTPYYKDDGRKWHPSMGNHQFWKYNCYDVMVTAECEDVMERDIEDEGLTSFYDKFYRRPFLHSLRMEWTGIQIDQDKLKVVKESTNARKKEIQTQLRDLLGYTINVQSPKQMQKMLYQDRHYPMRRNRRGKITADKFAVQSIATKNPNDPILALVTELKKLIDLESDILNQKLDANGIIHSHYKIGGTDGARWSSTRSILGNGTNLQNVPRTGIARELFIANETSS